MDARIDKQFGQEYNSRNHQADKDGRQQHFVAGRINGHGRSTGRIDDTGIVVHHGLCQRIFFPLVEQVKIQTLLDLLLSFNREQLACLGRHRCKFSERFAFQDTQVFTTHVERSEQVIDRAEYILSKRQQRALNLFHGGTLWAGGLQQALSLQNQVVVLRDFIADSGIFQTGVDRDRLVGFK